MSNNLNLDYSSISNLIQRFLVKGRTESRAFLVWFLKNFYRLEDVDAYDAVCDGIDDKGIDGIYVDDNLEQIDVFQCKLVRRVDRKLGDSQLKEFVGTLAQFNSKSGIKHIVDTTGNIELKKLIESSEIENKIEKGYSIKGVFVTNAIRDSSADQYLSNQPNLTLYDNDELVATYVPSGRSGAISKPVVFDIYGYDIASHKIGDIKLFLAPLSATQLVNLDGIENQELFAWNVRHSLGRTKVNREISKSIEQQSEHRNFLLFHNGLTILCKSIEADESKITVSGYSVVNGCQSLTTIYENRSKITDDLRVFCKLIQLDPESDLALKITHHSNNQNPINARDLQSNNILQIRLQHEFETDYPGRIFYQIKRGEVTDIQYIIDNQEAARILLAFDLKQPWTCHQTYKLFDELYIDLFARLEVTAHRIYALFLIYEAVVASLSEVDDQLMANYVLTKYLLIYILREALEDDDTGKKLCQDPSSFLKSPNGEERLKSCILRVLGDLIIDFNAEMKERTQLGKPVDYKREFKSPTSVRAIVRDIIPHYQKAVSRHRALSFGTEWAESA